VNSLQCAVRLHLLTLSMSFDLSLYIFSWKTDSGAAELSLSHFSLALSIFSLPGEAIQRKKAGRT
jgi:hypothetical protein